MMMTKMKTVQRDDYHNYFGYTLNKKINVEIIHKNVTTQ